MTQEEEMVLEAKNALWAWAYEHIELYDRAKWNWIIRMAPKELVEEYRVAVTRFKGAGGRCNEI